MYRMVLPTSSDTFYLTSPVTLQTVRLIAATAVGQSRLTINQIAGAMIGLRRKKRKKKT